MRRSFAVLASLLCLLALPGAAVAAPVPEGAEWHEEYFAAPDGTLLHADVLRPKGLPETAKTPVLLTVSPYTNHSGATTEFDPRATGPSDRFFDFLEGGKVFERGYTYVMVDLRGFGGSGGCNDWGGPGERMDSKAAVEWAASQPWSNGRVGIFGKSYDGWTGLMAAAERPKGLAAVLSMEPVYSGYKYLYMNGVRFPNSVATPSGFSVYDAKPGSANDSPEYLLNGVPKGCYPLNIGQQQIDDEGAAFWIDRNLIPVLKGVTTPVFLQQGFLETNTKPDGFVEAWKNLSGWKHAWFGQYDHVRGYEKQGEDFATGRAGFLEESMAMFDHFVRGDGPKPTYPTVAVQDITGSYRAEADWPPADQITRRMPLMDGSYTDDGENAGTGTGAGNGIWTFSQPLPHKVWLAGEPLLRGVVNGTPRSNLVALIYDISPEGTALLISRGAYLIRNAGEVELRMYGQDWPLEPGHRIGVLISSADSNWWTHVPTNTPVTFSAGSMELPFLTYERTAFLDGGETQRLRSHASTAFPVTVDEAAVKPLDLPPALAPMPAPPAVTLPAPKVKLTLSVRRARTGVRVRGRAPAGARIAVTGYRGRRAAVSRVARVRRGRYAVTLRGARLTRVVVRGAGQRVSRKVPAPKRKRR